MTKLKNPFTLCPSCDDYASGKVNTYLCDDHADCRDLREAWELGRAAGRKELQHLTSTLAHVCGQVVEARRCAVDLAKWVAMGTDEAEPGCAGDLALQMARVWAALCDDNDAQ